MKDAVSVSLRALAGLAVCMWVVGLTGCKSAFVTADIRNETGGPVTLLEVDYPSASFGKESLAAGAVYHYRFKILGSGGTAVSWTDAAHKQHSTKGPEMHEGQEGSVAITLGPSVAAWTTDLRN